jgi:hypothetical protein
MSTDRYLKAVLTVIASALVYLCVVLTPWPSAQAQTAARPGDPTGPAQVVVVGWRAPQSDRVPIAAASPLPVSVAGPVQVTGKVTTERSGGDADRVVLVGWEDRAGHYATRGLFRSFDSGRDSAGPPPQGALPVVVATR